MNNLDITNDDLEEQGLIEYCKHCFGTAIIEFENKLYCKGCHTVNFTKVISEEEYEEMMKLKI